jgi:hypothetical protein
MTNTDARGGFEGEKMERAMGIEPTTVTLATFKTSSNRTICHNFAAFMIKDVRIRRDINKRGKL